MDSRRGIAMLAQAPAGMRATPATALPALTGSDLRASVTEVTSELEGRPYTAPDPPPCSR